ncbi:protein-L-isoaspartate(D-aspartate) O-methyltransferase [Abyssibacter profundi]|uniref:Protein-L-isoaspartate O-methyltransferase n=1 Tax=Abyssibacter profundi TaxID=2182787 RepID=A0A363UPW4_9GAMM|nr:protein-L-isoaspartate(D-aspartate) O-methyltransferase [Abyssibacter profundi]MBV62683.1 protein-L-isoaspartate O-methyltransferase [Nevskiales bacterium]PWN57518.1 protein-L-isoaspartate(D-aspartate) O-methyltransferase [Abyssibacter profundi]
MTSERNRKRLVDRLMEEGIVDQRVLRAIGAVQRHRFVDEALANMAYRDTALPIGHGQTISQPLIVARMTEALLEAGPFERVLEVGTGSGYQAAVLAEITDQVLTVERIRPLYQRAGRLLRELGYHNVRLRQSDGSWGWPQLGPFERIVVTAGGSQIPEALREQLAPGGVLVIPVGPSGRQELIRVTRQGSDWHEESLGLVSFVPLVSD